MKTKIKLLTVAIIIGVVSCKKKDNAVENITPTSIAPYSSLQNFYSRNGVSKQIFSVSGISGGVFTSAKGTKVTIPPNAFVTQLGVPVTGVVTIEFKDIYSKSDMLLSNVPSMTYYGAPLKSAGEFFIRALEGTNALLLNTGKKITAEQPAFGALIDTAMAPFVVIPDSTGFGGGWTQTPNDSVSATTSSYIFGLYNFSNPADSGTWCNSDNSGFFSTYTQTTLTTHANDDMSLYEIDVFLVFSGINSMVHVYYGGGNDFPYSYAPQGLQCTIVAIGAKDGKLYSSFTPVTITSGLITNFSLTETTDAAFKAQVSALN
jgi:hypothetical protein